MCLKPLGSGILNKRTFDARGQFDELFAALLSTRTLPDSDTPKVSTSELIDDSQIGQLQAMALSQSQQLIGLSRHKKYSRHVIGTDGTWMGFICRWEPRACSSIHGHPSFAYYQVLQGEFSMDLYTTSADGLARHTDTKQLSDGKCIWKHGKSGCYDNFVHKISTHDTGGFTLHLFSENPSLGQHYAEV